ncbi:MAG: tetratricopeptide repeat protein [Bacteroidales bacterium]|nr:tetratricopeptide repeat protein [Bacteroidales bacterium]
MNKDNTPDLVKKYEEMLAQNVSIYFDADEFEEIAFYYEVDENYYLAYETVCYALQIHPGSVELQVKKALYLLCIDNKTDALTLIDTLHINSTQDLLIKADIYLANEKKEEAVGIVNQVIESAKPDFTLYLDIADVFANNDFLDDAIDYIKKGLSIFPDHPDLLRELAFTYGDNENFDEMVVALNTLLDLNPYEIADWISLIRAYGSMNHLEKAIEACDFALAIEQNNEEVQMMRAVCLYENGNSEAAASAFETCSKFPTVNNAFLLVVIQCFLELKRFDKALAVADKILKIDPLNADAYYQKSICFIGLKELELAFESITIALDMDAINADFLVVKANLLTERNDFAGAKQILIDLLIKEPDFYKAYFPLAFIYEQEEAWESALVYYRKSFDNNPLDLVSLLKVVKFYYVTGDFQSTIYYKLLLDKSLEENSSSDILTNEYLQQEYALTDEYIIEIKKIIK